MAEKWVNGTYKANLLEWLAETCKKELGENAGVRDYHDVFTSQSYKTLANFIADTNDERTLSDLSEKIPEIAKRLVVLAQGKKSFSEVTTKAHLERMLGYKPGKLFSRPVNEGIGDDEELVEAFLVRRIRFPKVEEDSESEDLESLYEYRIN